MRTAKSDERHQSASANATRGPLLDVDGVAEALGVTPRHIRRLVAERRIPFFKVGKFVRFDPGELDVWLDQQRVDVQALALVRPTQPADSLAHRKVAWSSSDVVDLPSAFASQLVQSGPQER